MAKRSERRRLAAAMERLEALLGWGELQASCSGADLLNAASDEIERLRLHPEVDTTPDPE
jgi:hypothetical protein